MIKVWILLLLFSHDTRGSGTNGPTVIDNLASKAECERVGAYLSNRSDVSGYYCVEAWKAVRP